MRILVLGPQHVVPPSDGGKAAIYRPLRAFAARHQVYYAFPPPPGAARPEVEEPYRRLGIEPVLLEPVRPETPARIAQNVLERLPFKLAKYNTARTRAAVRAAVVRGGVELLWVTHLHQMPTALALKRELGCAVVLRTPNVETDLVAQYAALHPSPSHRLVARWQLGKTRAFERLAWSRADEVLFISDSDLALARGLGAPARAERPLYEAVDACDAPPAEDALAPGFVYPLRISSVQNVFSARRFLREVWGPFSRSHPGFTLHVTGSTPDELARAVGIGAEEQGRLRVRAAGFVEDYAAFLRRHRYLVSPTYFGSGVRLKLVEALGQGCACLCTPLDLDSLRVLEGGQNVMGFSNAATFEESVRRLEGAPALRSAIRRAAWETARAHFSEKGYVDRVEAVLARLPVHASRTASGSR